MKFRVWFPFDGEAEEDAAGVDAADFESAVHIALEKRHFADKCPNGTVAAMVTGEDGRWVCTRVAPQTNEIGEHYQPEAFFQCCLPTGERVRHSLVRGDKWVCNRCGSVFTGLLI